MKLPFEKNPYIVSYHNKAFPLGVIQGNAKEDLTPWIAGKFINCYFNPEARLRKFEVYTTDPWGEGDGVNSSQTIRLDREMFDVLSIDVIQTVKGLLDSGYYVHGSYNERHIPAKKAYHREDFVHDYMLIGYEDSGVFHSIGYTKSDRYEEFDISFEDYMKSLYHSPNKDITINTCKFHEEGNFKLNKSNLIMELSDYINSTNSLSIHYNYIFGLDAVRELKKFVAATAKKQGIDYRFLKLFNELKALMQLRIDYLCCGEYSYLSQEYRRVSEAANQMYLLSIKYNLTRSQQELEHILENFDIVLKGEETILPQFLEAMKTI